MSYQTDEDLDERAADWEAFSHDPNEPEDARSQYAELARRDRAEIVRRESVSF